MTNLAGYWEAVFDVPDALPLQENYRRAERLLAHLQGVELTDDSEAGDCCDCHHPRPVRRYGRHDLCGWCQTRRQRALPMAA